MTIVVEKTFTITLITHTALHLSIANSNITQFDDTDFKKYLSIKYERRKKKEVLDLIQQI